MTKEEFDRARLNRQDRLRRDHARLPSMTTRSVGVEIFANSNFKTGTSFHAESTMAKSLGVNVKSVKRALPQLVAAGYIEITKMGRCNSYRIILEEQRIVDIMSPIDPPIGDIQDADRGHFRPAIGDTLMMLMLRVTRARVRLKKIILQSR